MEYITLPGESALTGPEAQKITNLLIRHPAGAHVTKVSGVYLHYAHLRQSDKAAAAVRTSHVNCSIITDFSIVHRINTERVIAWSQGR